MRSLLRRTFEQVVNTVGAGPSFTVYQSNILADCLSGSHPHKGGFDCPDEILNWNNRLPMILEEITQHQPDVICLQEVDHFAEMERSLSLHKYKGVFESSANRPYGVAILFNSEVFEAVDTVLSLQFANSNHKALLQFLQHKASARHVLVVNTHLTSDKTAEGETMRTAQVKQLLATITQHNLKAAPVVFCADLNAQSVHAEYPPTTYNTVLASEIGLSSAYSVPTGKEPAFTTWKFRKGGYKPGEAKMTIDYIFFSKAKLECTHLLSLPTEAEIGPMGLPSHTYPSDHLAVMARLRFL